jgi:FMN reductase
MSTRTPFILGLGGTGRPGSSTEQALMFSLERAAALGAQTRILGGEFLARLPLFDSREGPQHPAIAELIDAIRAADGLIIASPGYHGAMSGMIKNALDYLETTRTDARPYLEGRPIGLIVTAAGHQAGGTTLTGLRAVVHALHGWPTPFGAALNTMAGAFDTAGACRDPRDAWQLATVAGQVMEFLTARPAHSIQAVEPSASTS